MDISDYQAGNYRQQYEYKSFKPTTINHAWLVSDGDILRLLSDADRAMGELNAFSQLVPDVDFFTGFVEEPPKTIILRFDN